MVSLIIVTIWTGGLSVSVETTLSNRCCRWHFKNKHQYKHSWIFLDQLS